MKLQFKFSRIAIILIISILTSIVFASKVTGTVKQQGTTNTIQFATVSLLRTVDETIEMGQMTDSDGYFLFINVPNGEYRIQVKFIGFDPFWSLPFTIDDFQNTEKLFGDINIEQGIVAGEEVNVNAQKNMIEVKADKKVFNLDKLMATSGGTCCDVIKKVPGVDVGADGTISLRGSSNVAVLVSGKRTGKLGTERTTNALAVPVPASMIESVEIITNPSSEYDPDGMTGIINFVLKEEIVSGYNGEVTVNAGDTQKLNVGSTFSYRFPNTTIFSKFNYEDAEHLGNLKSDLGNGLVESENQRHAELNYYNGGINHSLSENQTISAEGSYIKKSGDIFSQNINDDVEYTFSNNIDATGLGISYNNSISENSDLDIEYSQDIQDETQQKINEITINDTIIYKRKVFIIDYKTKVNKIHFESGYKGRFNSYNNIHDDNIVESFLFDENINALYGLTSFKWNEIANLKFGLRYEWVNSDIDAESSNYSHLYPSAHVVYSLNPFTQLRTSFSSRVNRPSAKQLSPLPRSGDFSTIDTVGNSDLKPEFINSVEFGITRIFNKIKFDFTSYNHFIQDPILWVQDGDNISFDNSGSGKLSGIEALVKLKPVHNLDLRITGNYFQMNTENSSNSVLDGTTKGGYGRIIASYKTHGYGEFEINGTYKSRRDTPQGYQWKNGKFVLDFAYQLSILDDHLRLTFKGVDLLDNDHFESYYKDGNGEVYNYEKHDQRTFYVSLVYKFGNINN
jgi:outer membrane cobalamin receptor